MNATTKELREIQYKLLSLLEHINGKIEQLEATTTLAGLVNNGYEVTHFGVGDVVHKVESVTVTEGGCLLITSVKVNDGSKVTYSLNNVEVTIPEISACFTVETTSLGSEGSKPAFSLCLMRKV